jgi:hypothetical protein
MTPFWSHFRLWTNSKKASLPTVFFKKIPVEWNGRYETPAGKLSPRETLHAQIAPRRLPDRPGKASAWRQRSNFTNHQENVPVFSIRRLSAKPPRRNQSCGVLASQLFGRIVANFFNPVNFQFSSHIKNHECNEVPSSNQGTNIPSTKS